MGAVFDLNIPRIPKFVLLAMADPAADDGSNSYLAVETISKKTSTSTRGVQQNIHALVGAGYLEFVGKFNYRTKHRVAALLMPVDERGQRHYGHGFTAEYRLTLERGDKNKLFELLQAENKPAAPAPFPKIKKVQRAAKNPAASDGGKVQQATKNPAAPAPESFLIQSLTGSGTSRRGGGGCQDTESSGTTSAASAIESAVARAFEVFGFDKPFGHPAFRAAIVRRSAEIHDGNIVDAMEAVIQDCNRKVPPAFYKAKHLLEDEAQASLPMNEDLPGLEHLVAHRQQMATQLRQAAEDIGHHSPALAYELKQLADLADDWETPDIESTLQELESLDDSIDSTLAEHLGGKLTRDQLNLPRFTLSRTAAA